MGVAGDQVWWGPAGVGAGGGGDGSHVIGCSCFVQTPDRPRH